MVFRNFLKSQQLFDYLTAQFNAELPINPSSDDLEYFNQKKDPLQQR